MKAVYAMMAGLAVMACAGGASAAELCCASGAVVDAGSIFHNGNAAAPFSVATSHGVKLTCDTAVGTLPANTGRRFELLGPAKDAQLATALTALATGKDVWFCFASTADDPAPGLNTKGHIKAIYVTNTP